jgi:N-acetylmuramic acid 6-phosphate (MurNAc-6-P) etherase
MLKVKLLSRGKGLTPYISRVVTNGRVQRAFAIQIGKPAGACVRSGVHAGMTQTAIREVVAGCGRAHAGTKLNI